MATQICFICNSATENYQENLAEIKSRYSGYPLRIFMKKFLRNIVSSRNVVDASNCICAECLKSVNDYDALCVKAKMLEDYLHTLLVNSDKAWQTPILGNDVEQIEIHETKPLVQIEETLENKHGSASLEPTEEKRHECLECGKKFEHQIDFLHHERTHKTNQIETDLKGALCAVVSKNKTAFMEHCQMHRESSSAFQCVQCKKTFTKRYLLVAHMLKHTPSRNHQCKYCGKLFTVKSLLASHMKSHSDVRSAKCHICSKTFKRLHVLQMHIDVVHNEIKRYSCSICGKRFGHLLDKNAHELIHKKDAKKAHK